MCPACPQSSTNATSASGRVEPVDKPLDETVAGLTDDPAASPLENG